MPSVRKSFFRLKKMLDSRQFIKLLSRKNIIDDVNDDLNNIEKTILLKNEPLQVKTSINYNKTMYFCPVCGARLYNKQKFCGECSQRLKF